MKLYIKNFRYDLNYHKVILWIGNVDENRLYDRMDKDLVNHLYRFTTVSQNKYVYVENCDLQDLDFELSEYLEEGYSIYPLFEDNNEYYIEVDSFITSNVKK